ncbi:MAG TPA: FAD-dependent oxidoreductase [Bryobacteraceae bacterium]|nr:FAD-dependent oxidoreductase [Bryobacteraceae bacterium]
MDPQNLQTRCCIAGGGPAGMMLGFLLGRAGIETIVLEKHADFLRDFRGDTVHPSTLELMYELGLLQDFLKRPHQELPQIRAQIGSDEIVGADFSTLTTHCRFVALMPQWDFLNFLAEQGQRYPAFHVRMEAEVSGLLEEGGRIAGVRAKTPAGELEVRAELVVGADGRSSLVRERSGLQVDDLGAPMDVLWMRISRRPSDPAPLLRLDRGKLLVMLNREDYWQVGLVIRKGGAGEIREKGMEALRGSVVELAPFLKDRVSELGSWDDDVKLLTVKVDRLRQWWRPGLLCIGDAAHAMSPIGGVGINLAIQDAVAAANILAGAFQHGTVTTDALSAVQRRRALPTRLTQAMQVTIQNHVTAPLLASSKPLHAPWYLPFLDWPTRRIRSRFLGIGFRAEHIRTPDVVASQADRLVFST